MEEKMKRGEKQEASSDKFTNSLGAIEENLAQLRAFEDLLHSYTKHVQN